MKTGEWDSDHRCPAIAFQFKRTYRKGQVNLSRINENSPACHASRGTPIAVKMFFFETDLAREENSNFCVARRTDCPLVFGLRCTLHPLLTIWKCMLFWQGENLHFFLSNENPETDRTVMYLFTKFMTFRQSFFRIRLSIGMDLRSMVSKTLFLSFIFFPPQWYDSRKILINITHVIRNFLKLH